LQQQLAAAEQKLAAEKAALEAAKASQIQLEKRLADETAQIDPLTRSHRRWRLIPRSRQHNRNSTRRRIRSRLRRPSLRR
jgi:hypothetical protein